MTRITLTCLVLLTATPGAALHADELAIVRRARTWPRPKPGIPWRDYQFQARSRSETAISRTAVLLRSDVLAAAVTASVAEIPPGTRLRETITEETVAPLRGPRPGERGRETRYRQFERELDRRGDQPPPVAAPSKLYLLDLSQLEIDHCAVSQVALQIQEDGTWVLSLRGDQNRSPEPGEPAPYNPRLHIERNEFVVRLRCLGNFGTTPSELAVTVGKPVLADLGPVTFWVENGEPRYLRHADYDATIEKYYPMIDRVELEFFYR